MELFAKSFPVLCDALVAALLKEGRVDLANQFPSGEVGRVTFDDSIGASYVHIGPGDMPHGETVTLNGLLSADVDVDASGKLQGVEILSAPEPLKGELRRRAAVYQIVRADAER
ncbi:MAG: hypothetical protein ABIT36_04450 [Steroidobacteraceae bacterium]